MITITFNPQTPQQAAVVASAIGAYMAVESAPAALAEQQAKDLADAAANRADDAARAELQAKRDAAAAAKKPKAAKAASTSAETPESPAPTQPTAEAEAETTVSESKPESFTLEQVRAKLAALSQAGKAAQVMDLIASTGAAKLTDVPAEKYAQLMADAEALA